MVSRVKLVIGLETLKYLIRGGRAPVTGYIGELMKIKPIIGSVSGKGLVELLGRVRGRRKCLLRMAELVRQNTDADKQVNMVVHYMDGIAAGEELKDIIASQVACGEVYLTPLTPAMCSHLGPVVAVSFYS
jgi:fatty acid-binding protein DegV